MKLNKNIIIFALLLVMVLFCASAVSASNNFQSELGTADVSNDTLELNGVINDVASNNVKESEALASVSEGANSGEEILSDYENEIVTNDRFFTYFDENGDTITMDTSGEEGIDTIPMDTSGEEGIDTIPMDTSGEEGIDTIPMDTSGEEIPDYETNIVTNDTFFTYFDESGIIKKDIPFDELQFVGEFSELGIDTITIDTFKLYSASESTVFKNIGFKILAANVKLSDVKFVMENVDGAAIDIKADGVTIQDVNVDYNSSGKNDSFAIRAIESNNLNLIDNVIRFNAGYNASFTVYRHAIQIRNSDNVTLKGNKINAKLPALDVSWIGSGIDQDLPLAIGIQNGENISVTKNIFDVSVKQSEGSFPTLDSLMADGFKNLELIGNNFTQTDFTGNNKAGYSNVVDLYKFNGATVSGNTIVVNTTTGVDGAGTAYAIQATGPYSGFVIDGNNLTSESKGPSLGIYSQNYDGETDITIINNVIDVKGYAGENVWALVSGMELQDTVAKVSGNTINSSSINDYNDTYYLFGISYAQRTNGNHSYNVTDNVVTTGGKYAVFMDNVSDTTITENTLFAHELEGDDAVSIVGDRNVVENNHPPYHAIINIDVANSWSGNNNTIAINVVNATGTVNVKVNNKGYGPITLKDGNASFEIPASDIEVGINKVTVTYNGNKEISADSKDVTFYGLDNVVFKEVFFDFFDESGTLKEDVPYNDLIFKGAFAKSSTVQYVIIDRPVSISSDGASLSLMGIFITADNVTVDGLSLTTTVNNNASALGDLIRVNANNVTLSNLNINYTVMGDYGAIAINVIEVDNVKILNNTIVFSSVISSDEYYANAINLDRVTNALVDNNTITSTLPALNVTNYDKDYYMMGLNTVNPVRMKEVKDSVFSRNIIDSSINNLGPGYPTIQCLFIVGSENILFDSNSFNMVDKKTKVGSPTYLYAFAFGYNKNITVLNNDFYVFTNGGQDSAGTAYALQGVESEIYVIGNNITTISNGPNLGFYVASMNGGSSESYIINNTFNVTGYATSISEWALISGVEITNGNSYIYNNTFYTYNKAGYVKGAPVHGVSYAQFMYGERSFDIQNNTMYIQGEYTVGIKAGTKANVTNNVLYAEELMGDDSVLPGVDGIVENNTPPFNPEIIIDGQAAWIGTNSTITVTVPNGTGNVTIRIGNKTFEELVLENNTVTVDVSAEDLVLGKNNIAVGYNGDKFIKKGNATGNLEVIGGVITNETFKYYFDEKNKNYLFDYVPENVILDFQGPFIGGDFSLFINKPENIVSTTGDAVFDSGANPNYNWFKFNVVTGANHTNITGISIVNGDLFIQGASYVTIDGIDMKANMRGVGSGTGFLSIHSEAYYTTVKNSHFENGGTGSSCVVLGKGGKYATFDNNVFDITGSSGNVLSSNIYVGTGDNPEFVNYTNNVINSQVAASPFMYGITVCGQGNIIENNTLNNFKGNGIVNQYGATSTKNVYRNNTITGGGSMAIGTYSLVENNHIDEGALTVTEGCTFTGNTAKSLTINGKDVVATDNIVYGAVVFNSNAKNTTFKNNDVNGLITVNSNDNIISDNIIFSAAEYSVDLKSTSNNTVTDNILYADELVGDASVNFDQDKNNTVENNFPIDPVLVVEAADITVGENATIHISFKEIISDTVEVIVDGKKYTVEVEDGKGQLNVSGLEANKFTVSASYDGDLIYIPTTNSTTFNVNKLGTDDALNITVPSDVKVGDNVTVGVSIPGATGNVTVIVDGKATTVPLDENGTASVPVSEVTAGEHDVVVIYSGDDTHASAYSVSNFTVPDYIATEFANITIMKDLNITAVLVDANGNPIANAIVSYVIANVSNSTLTGADGSFTIKGEYSVPITISYAGNNTYLATNTSLKLDNKAAIRTATVIESSEFTQYACDFYAGEKGHYFDFYLKDSNGNPLANKFIQIGFNGVVYNRTTDDNGFAHLQINLKNAGLYTFAIAFLGDDDYNGSFVVQKITIIKKTTSLSASAKTFKATAKTKKYTVTLKTIKGASIDGKTYLKAGKKVTLKINGKTYTGKTKANGKVTFNIKLTKKGTYTAKIKFAGDNTYNAASKKVKIKIK